MSIEANVSERCIEEIAEETRRRDVPKRRADETCVNIASAFQGLTHPRFHALQELAHDAPNTTPKQLDYLA